MTPPPTSCADLAQLGNRINGFHLVLDKDSNNRIQTVFCDFAFTFNNPGTSPYSFQALYNLSLITSWFNFSIRLRNCHRIQRHQNIVRCILLRPEELDLFINEYGDPLDIGTVECWWSHERSDWSIHCPCQRPLLL